MYCCGDLQWNRANQDATNAPTFPCDRTRQLSDDEAKQKLAKKYELLDPDVRLMLQVKAGDAAAFEALVAKYQARLVGILRHMISDKEQAEDLAQEVFLRVYRAREIRWLVFPLGCSQSRTTSPAVRC